MPSVIFLLMILSGCWNASGARVGLFSATGPVIAILEDDLFVGEVEGFMNRRGSITMRSKVNPDIHCIGEFQYTSNRNGSGQMQCNDGTAVTFQFQAISTLSGYGYGRTLRGPVSFTYGLTIDESEQYLKIPLGKRIRKTEKTFDLVPI